MHAAQLFHESKSLPFPGQDTVETDFVVVRTSGYDGFDVTVFRGTLSVGHYGGYDNGTRYWNKDVDQSDYLQVVNTFTKTEPEIVREAIKRCDWWFGECEKRLTEAGQGAKKQA